MKTSRRTRREQHCYLAAAIVYAAIALFLLSLCTLSMHALFTTSREFWILATATFGLAGCGATFAALYGFRKAVQ